MSDERLSLSDLEPGANFIRRHIGPGEPQIDKMLADLGLEARWTNSLTRWFPNRSALKAISILLPAKSERETLSYLRKMADRNMSSTPR